MQSPIVRKVLVVFVLLLGGLYFLWQQNSEHPIGLTLIDPAELLSPSEKTPEEEPGEISISGRDLLTTPRELEPTAPMTVRGRVVTVEGAPVPDVDVVQRHPTFSAGPARSGRDGAFEIVVRDFGGELAPDSTRWILLGGRRFLAAESLDDYQLIVAPAVTLGGTVEDARGEPVVAAAVHALAPGDALLRFGTVSTPVEHESQHTWTDARGGFRVGPLPDLEGTRIEVTASGFAPASVALPTDRTAPFKIVLSARD